MDLSIIIVNWNSLTFTRDCIASLSSTIHGLEYEVIVVDNASQDDLSGVDEQFPAVRLVQSERNIGFAGANILGFTLARGKNVLFLNPDTIVFPEAINQMVSALESSGKIGAVGCRLLNSDSSLQLSCVQPFPTISNQLFAIDWIKRRWPQCPLWGMRSLFAKADYDLCDVDAVSGACLMVRREAYESVGGFSTEYFMYAEEVDLCFKLQRAGWRVCHVPKARVTHFGGQSTKKKEDGFADIMMRESVFTLLRKFRGDFYARGYKAALFASALMRLALLSPLRLIPGGRDGHDAVGRAFRKWRRIAAWSLSLERLTERYRDATGATTRIQP